MSQNVEHHQAIFHPAPRRNLVTKDQFLAVVVRASVKEKLAGVFAQHLGARSIEHRFPYITPLNHLQVDLIRRFRAGQTEDKVQRGILISINGVAAGLRNTG